jgi:hypothetical protein
VVEVLHLLLEIEMELMEVLEEDLLLVQIHHLVVKEQLDLEIHPQLILHKEIMEE